MTTSAARERIAEVAAMLLIGDGVVSLLHPRRHALLWRFGPKAYRQLIDVFVQRPNLTRALSALEAGLGIWWASKQTPR